MVRIILQFIRYPLSPAHDRGCSTMWGCTVFRQSQNLHQFTGQPCNPYVHSERFFLIYQSCRYFRGLCPTKFHLALKEEQRWLPSPELSRFWTPSTGDSRIKNLIDSAQNAPLQTFQLPDSIQFCQFIKHAVGEENVFRPSGYDQGSDSGHSSRASRGLGTPVQPWAHSSVSDGARNQWNWHIFLSGRLLFQCRRFGRDGRGPSTTNDWLPFSSGWAL